MKSRLFFLLVLMCITAGKIGNAGAASTPPNVIIVLTDDQGYGDFSIHGNPILKTPNLDQLAKESIRLTDFHVAPMCTPTRGQLMTGIDALRNKASSVTAGRSFVRPGIPMMPEMFAASGYKTGLFGKWHLGDNYPHRPMDKGFQTAIYHKGWGFTSAPEFTNTLFNGRYFDNGMEKKFDGYCTDVWFQHALKWMQERKEKSEPFFCYIPTNAPHAPLVVAEKYAAPYKDKGPADFFGMIANIDENIGKLEAFLKSSGLRENTIIIFMTDNGGTAGVKTYNAGMRGHKTTYYDGGHRVPCFVRWPAGNLQPPSDIAVPTQNQDLLPTLIELCGLKKPEQAQFDGTSLAGLWKGSATLPDRMLVVQYGQIPAKWDSCVIWDKWRLVKGTELYKIDTDRGQEKDIAAQHPDVLKKMRDHYESWWAGIEPKLNDFVTISIGTTHENPVQLTSSDWESIYADNSNHIRQAVGGPRGGAFNLLVERDGDYELTLQRWPPEANLPLGAENGPKSKTFNVKQATVEAAGKTASGKAGEKATSVVVRMKLPAGKTQLKAWFQNERGEDLCGAYYVAVKRLD